MYVHFISIAWCVFIFSAFNASALVSLNITLSMNATVVNGSYHCPMTLDNWVTAMSTLDIIVLAAQTLLIAGHICNNAVRERDGCIFRVWDTLICFIGGHLAFFGGMISLFIYSTLGFGMSRVCRFSDDQSQQMFTVVTIQLITIPLWSLTYMILTVVIHRSATRRGLYHAIEEN
jgi:hypothetical protein